MWANYVWLVAKDFHRPPRLAKTKQKTPTLETGKKKKRKEKKKKNVTDKHN